MSRLLSQMISAGLGIWLATLFVNGVVVQAYPTSSFFGFQLTAQWQVIVILGIVLGLINHILKPLLKLLALPLEIITLGFFTIVIDMGLVWFMALAFDELTVPFPIPLLYTVLIMWGTNLIINLFLPKKVNKV